MVLQQPHGYALLHMSQPVWTCSLHISAPNHRKKRTISKLHHLILHIVGCLESKLQTNLPKKRRRLVKKLVHFKLNKRSDLYLFLDRTSRKHGTPEISSGGWVIFSNLLSIFPPLVSIFHYLKAQRIHIESKNKIKERTQ